MLRDRSLSDQGLSLLLPQLPNGMRNRRRKEGTQVEDEMGRPTFTVVLLRGAIE
jgi:hypothetical protein